MDYQDRLKALYETNPADAREQALQTLLHYERKGGFFSLTGREQEIWSYLRKFLIHGTL